MTDDVKQQCCDCDCHHDDKFYEDQVAAFIKKYVRVKGGGDVQLAFGRN